MDLGRKCKPKKSDGAAAAGLDDQITVRLPDLLTMRVVARSVLLAFLILGFPWFGNVFRSDGAGGGSGDNAAGAEVLGSGDGPRPIDEALVLPMQLNDLKKEGLLRPGVGRALFVGDARSISPFLKQNEIDQISRRDLEILTDGVFDFVFSDGSAPPETLGRLLKPGGVVAFLLAGDAYVKLPRHPVVYVRRRFGSTVVAMRMPGSSPGRRRLMAVPTEVLEGLEKALLEPPRTSSSSSKKKYLRRTKYLPDLTGDTLDGYPRRVFVDVAVGGKRGRGSAKWFAKNYPRRDRDFVVYEVETEEKGQVGIAEWMGWNLREEEYVVMKAEAEVVEEIVRGKAIGLVDELFLECKGGGGRRRVYWECLALYGRLRDQGVAVHQWWGY
ncbi:hypothetical protein QJS04_geneDACA019624 [Acorus gramineus]|uniref:DUF7870 domain-containing protein n=1 Tax=Acorus gramineus TaxID=55184 RepID=A0AAV9BM46_ACOGR|nr:hypothetical protein QJS04_geneDACA019624 [Acorus gramineus]